MTDRTREEIELDEVMRTHAGRAVLLRILERTGYFDSTFNKDPIAMAAFSAQREIGIELVSQMSAANNGQFINILKEKFNER